VVELAYFEGLSQVEIAARLGQPLGTVNVRMKMAMRNLATLLSPYGLLNGDLRASVTRAASLVQAAKAKDMRGTINEE
jgi:hypothetical protein